MNNPRWSILLIEDDEDDYILTRDLLAEVLGPRFDLDWQASYEGGLAALLHQTYDVCLTDYRLGERDGLELVRAAQEHNCTTPIIVLTGQGDQTVDAVALGIGAANYLVKGQTSAPLLERSIRHAIERASAARALRESEERFRVLFEQCPDGILLVEPAHHIPWTIVDCNAVAARMNGYTRAELIGQPLSVLDTQYADREHMTTYLDQLRGGVISGEGVHLRKDGSRFPIEYSSSLIWLEGRELMMGIDRDITDRKRSEEELRRSGAYFRALIEHASDIIYVVSADGDLRYTSPAQLHVLGFAPDDRKGGHAFGRIHSDDRPLTDRLFARLLRRPGETVSSELRVEHRKGGWRTLEATATNLLEDPDVAGVVINARDITERKVVEAQLVHDTMHDALTGLPNRTLLFDRLSHALGRAARYPDRQFGVLFLDLDRFKTVNDSLGHLIGDQLLQEVARRLITCVRPGDSVARLGGDEFAILLEELVSIDAALIVAERIHQDLLTPVQLGDETVLITASIGITVSTPEQSRPEDLLRNADIALYRAKHLGKARTEVFDPAMLDEALTRRHLEEELHQAIERNEFVLHYQPIVTVALGTMQGVEALVRWQHPTRGLVPPGVFIPIAEETGLIVPLGTWVLRAACKQIAAWREAGHPSWYVSVNLAALQLRQADLPLTLQSILNEYGLDPSALELELTESNAMADPKRTAAVLAEARALGLHGISLDDFGTGYSSLSYLQQFPITRVKIDRSFVRDMNTNANSAALARTIVAMAHSLQLTVVAEGVETEAQLTRLRAYGCDAVQGYHFSAALPAEELEQFLLDRALRLLDPDKGEHARRQTLPDDVLANLRRTYLEALRRGNRASADEIVRRSMDLGLAAGEVALMLMQPVAYEIGELWRRDKLSIAQEHLATAIMEHQLGALHTQVVPRRTTSRTLVLACVAGELHRMGSRMIADAFEEEGWRVVYLGADVPIVELVAIVGQERPDLVGLSAHDVSQLPHIEATSAALRLANLGGIPILVGGYLFVQHPEFAERVGASGTALDAADAVQQAERILAGTRHDTMHSGNGVVHNL